MKTYIKLSAAFVVGAGMATMITIAIMRHRQRVNIEQDVPTTAARLSSERAKVASAPSCEPSSIASGTGSPTPSRKPDVTMMPQSTTTNFPSVADHADRIMRQAEATIKAEGYDKEKASRYRIHIARTMARQGMQEPRLRDWVSGEWVPGITAETLVQAEHAQLTPHDIAEQGIILIENALRTAGLPWDAANAIRYELAVQLIAGGADQPHIEQWFEQAAEEARPSDRASPHERPVVCSQSLADIGRKASHSIQSLLNNEQVPDNNRNTAIVH